MRERFEQMLSKTPEVTQQSWETVERHLAEVYENSALFEQLGKQRTADREPTALFTDIDNTFYRSDAADASKVLTEKAAERSYPLVAVTGNSFEVVKKRIDSGELPPFSVILGAVGTEAWVLQKGEQGAVEYKQDRFFKKLLQEAGYDRPALAASAQKAIEDLAVSNPELKLTFQEPQQEEAYQKDLTAPHQPFKISFHFYADERGVEVAAQEFNQRFPGQSIVVCEEIGHNSKLPAGAAEKKYCVDILPIGKGEAVQYISKLAGIKQGVVAGDSGNDVGMLTESGALNAVLVGGYKAEAKKGIEESVGKRLKPGTRSFQRIVREDGSIQAIYMEQGNRLAADSILRAGEILERAERMKKLRNQKEASA